MPFFALGVAWLGACLPLAASLANEGVATTAEAKEFSETVKPLLDAYCVRCHGAKQQKAERRFDQLAPDLPDDNALVDLQDILDQLNLGAMPPEGAKQPTVDERRRLVRWLSARIKRYHQNRAASSNETVLRRMNSREYRATVRELLRINMLMFDPTVGFPRDQTVEHLDNVGGALVMSGYLLSRHLGAAEKIVQKVMRVRERPKVQAWRFTDGFRQQPEIDQVHRKTNGLNHMTLYDVVGADKHEGAYGPILAFREGVPHDGYYDIRIRAEAMNRINPYDSEFLGRDPSEPLRIGIVAGHREAGPLHKPQPIEPLLAELDLDDDGPKSYTVRVWMDKGFTPRFTFQNGLMDARTLWSRLVRKYPDQFPRQIRGGIVEVRFNAIKYGKLPHIRIHEIEIEGPHYDVWPTAAHRAVLGDDWERAAADDAALTDVVMRKHLQTFMTKAYRRPVAGEEVDVVEQVIQSRIETGVDRWQAYADGLKVVLCSPNFLYLNEGQAEPSQRLGAHQLAARLSYFLWSTLPDDQLRRLADNGELLQPKVLRDQVQRMLSDSRSDAFVDGFLDSWLTLRQLGATPPDRGQFRAYYQYNLRDAMRRETFLFARQVLDEDRPISEFLDTDFTWVNKRLAELYQIPWEAEAEAETGGDGELASYGAGRQRHPEGLLLSKHEFRRVKLTSRRRGGLLGQASVLTVTANGIETSPVTRGVWMLENLLGTPPSPPPPDVEPLDPDVRGAKTIREQLDKHRSVASCYDCHRSIDPLGFALENFDPIGRWRDRYDKRSVVDASGKMPTGEEFANVAGLKTILAKRQLLFARALSSKLLEYGTGRQLTPADRPQIDEISQAAMADAGFREVITRIVLSEPFRSP